ncbi:MAG: hypothetical protein AAGJ79_10115 [Verrucomicrobiota bacterium]
MRTFRAFGLILLGAISIFGLIACKNEELATRPGATLSFPDDLEFDDFLGAAALLSQTEEVVFEHNSLPQPVMFASGRFGRYELVGDAVTGYIRDQQWIYNDSIVEEDELSTRIQELMSLAKAAGDLHPVILISADNYTSMGQGLQFLRTVSEGGIRRFALENISEKALQTVIE